MVSGSFSRMYAKRVTKTGDEKCMVEASANGMSR